MYHIVQSQHNQVKLFCHVLFSGQPVGGPGGWAQPAAQPPPNCPPGLEYLASVDQMLVKQKVEVFEGN